MRYVMMLMGLAILAGGALVCPEAARAEFIQGVVPDPDLAAEIDAAIRALIEQFARMSPEFSPEGRV